MRQAYLAAAALVAATAIPTAPAAAQAFTDSSFSAAPATGWVSHSRPSFGIPGDHRFGGNFGCGFGGRDRDHHHGMGGMDGHMHRGGGGSGCAIYSGWGYYEPDINRSWDSDSFNDWWHDRPDRAYPRWVQHNEGCTPDRMWWRGSVLTC